MYPSLRLLSSRLISSILVAFAMAALTRSASSFDMSLPLGIDALGSDGSSDIWAGFVEVVVTVVDSVSANAVRRPSGVRNVCFPTDLSCKWGRIRIE